MRVCEPLRGSLSFLRDPVDVSALSRSQDVAYEASTCQFFPLAARRGRGVMSCATCMFSGSKRPSWVATEVRIESCIDREGPNVLVEELSKCEQWAPIPAREASDLCSLVGRPERDMCVQGAQAVA